MFRLQFLDKDPAFSTGFDYKVAKYYLMKCCAYI